MNSIEPLVRFPNCQCHECGLGNLTIEPQLERWTLNGWSVAVVEWLGKDWSGSVDLDSGSVGRLIRSVDLAPPAHRSHQPGVISRTDSKQTRSPWNQRIQVWILENTDILSMILWLGWVTPEKFSLMNVLESYCSEGCQVMFLFGAAWSLDFLQNIAIGDCQ